MSKTTADEARRLLGNVDHWKAFWVNNGPIYKSLGEFATKAKTLNAKQFTHHVNEQKNDFAKWISEAVGDSTLAKAVSGMKTRDAIAKAASRRVSALKKIAK